MSQVRLPKPGETWRFPNGVTLAFVKSSGLWSGSDCTIWYDRDVEALARNGAIVLVEPEVYDGAYTCDKDGEWCISSGYGHYLKSKDAFRTNEGDVVKWRIEVIRK